MFTITVDPASVEDCKELLKIIAEHCARLRSGAYEAGTAARTQKGARFEEGRASAFEAIRTFTAGMTIIARKEP